MPQDLGVLVDEFFKFRSLALSQPRFSFLAVPFRKCPSQPGRWQPSTRHPGRIEFQAAGVALDQLARLIGLDHAASNEWVIGGARTASGKPLLANDPHLGLEAPILWYLARIVTPQVSVKGGTVPGGMKARARFT